MTVCNVHVVEFSLDVKEKINEKSVLYCKKQLKVRSKNKAIYEVMFNRI